MNAHGPALELELPANTPDRARLPVEGLLERLGHGVLRRVRQAAWRLLDLGTEFEPLD